jgi:peroxiredoxin Q/BCP
MRVTIIAGCALLLVMLLGCNKAAQSGAQAGTAQAPAGGEQTSSTPATSGKDQMGTPAGDDSSGAMAGDSDAEQNSPGESDNDEDAAGSTSSINIGDPAPEFTLPGYPQLEFNPADYRGRQAVVLYFYPKDGTAGCTKEACDFRDTAAQFADQNAAIVGISQDDLASHEEFAGTNDLPFPLLYDAGGKVRELFGNPDGGTPLIPRITYVIDKQGVVRDIINADGNAAVEDHISGALAAVTKLNEGESESTAG